MPKENDVEDALDALVKSAETAKKVSPKKEAKSVISMELTADEKLAIDAEVEAEIAKELKAEKRKEYKAAKKQALKKQVLFRHGKDEEGEDTELVLITLASHMPYIRLDGEIYYPNRAYRLGKNKAAVIKEQMFRGDLHDNEIHGKKMAEFYGQRPRNVVIGPNNPIPADLIN